MYKPHFIAEETNITPLEEVKGEPSYEEKIHGIEGKNLLIKKLKSFSNQEEAQNFIKTTPVRRKDPLSKFIPKTDYVLGNDGSSIAVYAFSEKVSGKRLDKVAIGELKAAVIDQLDSFLSESLDIYEKEGVCPGFNYKNFVIDDSDHIWYVDSEPYPKNTHEPFEIAHARESRLSRDFGENAKTLFPKTWEWIETNRSENYVRAKSVAKAKRRSQKVKL